jgi:hypothetical protein
LAELGEVQNTGENMLYPEISYNNQCSNPTCDGQVYVIGMSVTVPSGELLLDPEYGVRVEQLTIIAVETSSEWLECNVCKKTYALAPPFIVIEEAK